MVGHESYRIADHWGAERKIFPVESELKWRVPNITFVGDANTHSLTWPRVIAQKRDVWENNLGRVWASNDWIGEQALRVMEIHPSTKLVVQWTDTERYLYVDNKSKYRDFSRNKSLERDTLFATNKPEIARKAFYDVDNPMWGLQRLMFQVLMVDQYSESFGIPCVQVFSFLDDSTLDFVRKCAPRKCVLNPLYGEDRMERLKDWVLEKLP